MSEQNGKSVVHGPGHWGNVSYQVFRVTEGTIECAECGKQMEPGIVFTRRLMPGGGRARYPVCYSCRRFIWDGAPTYIGETHYYAGGGEVQRI
jgi:hypothetical protein